MGSLFEFDEERKSSMGRSNIQYKRASSILTEGKGFMGAYDYTLNPYSGCSFGCSYCYAAFFSRTEEKRTKWGYWVEVKENALQLLAKFRRKSLHGKTIYMSSVTDPYQPIEKELNLTRSILQELLIYHQPRLVVQTRSSLVVRDIDLLKGFENVQINMTITTDSENVRKAFEPLCPSNTIRLNAIKEITNAGINTCITMTPLLPVQNAERFAEVLRDTGVKKFIIQPFHADKGKFVASTREKAVQLINEMGWSINEYHRVFNVIQNYIPEIGIGKEGFKPI